MPWSLLSKKQMFYLLIQYFYENGEYKLYIEYAGQIKMGIDSKRGPFISRLFSPPMKPKIEIDVHQFLLIKLEQSQKCKSLVFLLLLSSLE